MLAALLKLLWFLSYLLLFNKMRIQILDKQHYAKNADAEMLSKFILILCNFALFAADVKARAMRVF